MQTLSPQKQAKAVAFLNQQARPLEQTLYAYHFQNGSAEAVLSALFLFQNPDGGFGKALEADLRVESSSVIATSVAFQKFRETGTPASHPMVQSASRYLLATLDPQQDLWPIIPPNVDDAPHAPWWEYNSDLSLYSVNPRAELVGYLFDYPELFPANLRARLLDTVANHLLAQPDAMEMHDLMCYLRLSETLTLPENIRASLIEKLRKIVAQAVHRDPASWGNYGLTPLSVVNIPASPFADLFEKELDVNLDYEITKQPEEGYWSPTWSWEFVSAEAWGQARQEWCGVITLNNLLLFKKFGRLATD